MTSPHPQDCRFCDPKQDEVLDQNELGLTIIDTAPVAAGHCIVIPRRHAATYFDLRRDEVLAIDQLLHRARERLLAEDLAITGFNIINDDISSRGIHMNIIAESIRCGNHIDRVITIDDPSKTACKPS